MTVETNLEAAPTPRIPIWQTVKAGYRNAFGNFRVLLTAAALPIVISALLEATIPEESAWLRILPSFAAIALFEIVWLRFLLLPSPDTRPGFLPNPGRRFWPFFGYYLLLLLPYLPALFFQHFAEKHDGPVPVLSIALIAVLYALGIYLGARFSFAFLWIATDAPQRLGASWRTTRKNGLRLIIALCLVAVPPLLLLFGIGALATIFAPEIAAQIEAGEFEGWVFWAVLLVGNVLLYLYYAVTCTVLVHAFSVLTGWNAVPQEILERFE